MPTGIDIEGIERLLLDRQVLGCGYGSSSDDVSVVLRSRKLVA